MDNVPYVLGRAPAAACVRWVPGKPTLMHLVPRPGATDEQARARAGRGCGSCWACPSCWPPLAARAAPTPVQLRAWQPACSAAVLSCPARRARPPPASLQGAPLRERTFELPPLFIFHHANAFEEGGRLVVDSIHVRGSARGRGSAGWLVGRRAGRAPALAPCKACPCAAHDCPSSNHCCHPRPFAPQYDSLPAVGREALAEQQVRGRCRGRRRLPACAEHSVSPLPRQQPTTAHLHPTSAHLCPPLPSLPPTHPPTRPLQIDPDVAFRSRLRRVELDLGTGQLRIASVFDKARQGGRWCWC